MKTKIVETFNVCIQKEKRQLKKTLLMLYMPYQLVDKSSFHSTIVLLLL